MFQAIEVKQELLPCSICKRTFLPAPLAKHFRVCERSLIKKRKVFDSLKQRVEGTDLELFHQKRYLKKQESSSSPTDLKTKPNNWKKQHIEFVNAIRAAKGKCILFSYKRCMRYILIFATKIVGLNLFTDDGFFGMFLCLKLPCNSFFKCTFYFAINCFLKFVY